MRAASAVVALLLTCAASVQAQERSPYAGGSVLVSTQGSERPGSSPSFPTTGVGGTTLGVALDAGGFLSPSLSISFEASIPNRLESIQETDYFSVFRTENKHRDVILSGLFHAHTHPAGRLRVAIVGGPSVVREDTIQRTAFKPGPPLGITGDFGPFGEESALTRWTVGLTGGVDAEIRLGPHASLVPQFRIHWVQRAESGDGDSGFLGLSAWIWRPAIGVRARF